MYWCPYVYRNERKVEAQDPWPILTQALGPEYCMNPQRRDRRRMYVSTCGWRSLPQGTMPAQHSGVSVAGRTMLGRNSRPVETLNPLQPVDGNGRRVREYVSPTGDSA